VARIPGAIAYQSASSPESGVGLWAQQADLSRGVAPGGAVSGVWSEHVGELVQHHVAGLGRGESTDRGYLHQRERLSRLGASWGVER